MKERIKELCKRNDISMNALEKKLGFGAGYISKLKNSNPNMKKISAIADYFNVSVDYILYGKSNTEDSFGNMLLSSGLLDRMRMIMEGKDDPGKLGVLIPVLGDVAAGIPISAVENVIGTEEITRDMAMTGEYFGLRIKGDSMAPRIQDGDVVIVRVQPDANSGDVVIVKVNGDSATCKRLKKYAEGIGLISFNPAYEPINFTDQECIELPVTIIGKVVENRQKF